MPGSREEDFKRNNAFLLNDIWPRPSTRTPATGVMKCTIFVDPGHHYCKLSLCEPCSRVEKNILLRNTSILQFYSKITSPLWWEFKNLQFLVSLTYTCYKSNFIRLAQKSLKEDVNARRTTTYANP